MSAWEDFVTAALIGTEKAAAPGLPAALEGVLGACGAMDRETGFLTRAGALALSRRAGWQPAAGETPMAPAQPEATREISRASAAHGRVMLGGRHLFLLAEWLGEAARLGRHLPPELLPALLERAVQDRALRPLALGAGGRRIHWLAAHQAAWAFAGAAESPDLWETGSRDQRAAIIRADRAANPREARLKIEAVWKNEPADVRAAFAAALLDNLSAEDAPFLEAALEDRSKEVRRVAADLLARLPGSAFVARMTGRAVPLLVFKKGKLLSRASLEVTLPPEPDPAGLRDGLDGKAFGLQKALGEKAVLLVQILAAVPLSFWSESFGESPENLLKLAEKNEFGRALATGWAWAALRQGDAAWAAVLLDAKAQPHTELLPGAPLLALLPEDARAERLIGVVRSGILQKNEGAAWHSLAAQLAVFPGHWPQNLGREVLGALRLAVREGLAWHLRAVAQSLLANLPPALLAGAAHGWPADKEGVGELVETLTFRHDALLALSQS